MKRTDEVEVFAALLAEPARGTLRRAVEALPAGRSEAGAVADLSRRRPALRWVAFLLALESAELRLGGAVELETPRRRYALEISAPVEVWGPFACVVWPAGDRATLELEADGTGYSVAIRDGARTAGVLEAVRVVAREVAMHLGTRVRAVA